MSANPIDWRDVYVGRVRGIEAMYGEAHRRLLNWGRWGRDEQQADDIEPPGIFLLKGEYDPGLDEGSPEPAMVPIDNKDARAMDAAISKTDFPTVWRLVLKANYVRQLPEWQRYREARTSAESYLEFLSGALLALCVDTAREPDKVRSSVSRDALRPRF